MWDSSLHRHPSSSDKRRSNNATITHAKPRYSLPARDFHRKPIGTEECREARIDVHGRANELEAKLLNLFWPYFDTRESTTR